MRRVIGLAGSGVLVVLLAGCSDEQSTLEPKSHAARAITTMWWIMFVGATVVCMVVTLLVVLSLLKRRGRLDRVHARDEAPGARNAVLIAGAAVPVVVLVALFVYVLATVPATAEPKARDTRMTIDVTGKQWFWDVRYRDQHIRTANEIHIPVGEKVRIQARTDDVIHSFWVPELNRKIDMIPGYDNAETIESDRPGVFRGQCAEFCGLQHANMSFFVVVQPRAQFDRWVAREQKAPPTGMPGEKVFTSVGCSGCHRIQGVSNGDIGPDLTHLASRRTIAAATVANTRGWLGGWILDPQHIKPGNKMPALPVSGPQLQQLLDYLEALK